MFPSPTGVGFSTPDPAKQLPHPARQLPSLDGIRLPGNIQDTMATKSVLSVSDLSKTFHVGFVPYRWAVRGLRAVHLARPPIVKVVRAVAGLSFEVNEGEIFGLLGPNGAGKTTTIKMIVGLLRPDQGTIRIFGQAPTSLQARRRLGFLPENPSFYDYLRAEEFLDLQGRLTGLDRRTRRRKVPELLELVGLTQATDRQLRKFSKGMLQRLGLAQALLADPELVILDEPLSGLDPIGRKEIRDIVAALAQQGKTVVFSSHILSDVERLCHRVAIVQRGRITDSGPLAELLATETKATEIVFEDLSEDLAQDLSAFGTLTASGNRSTLLTTEDVSEILQRALAKGGRVVSVTPQTRTLEDIFVARTATSDRKEEQGHAR